MHCFFYSFEPNKVNVDFYYKLWNYPHVYKDLIKIINVKNVQGDTPLFVALQNNWPEECVDVLVENGATLYHGFSEHPNVTPESLRRILTRNCILTNPSKENSILVWDFSIFASSEDPFNKVCVNLNNRQKNAVDNAYGQMKFDENHKPTFYKYRCNNCDILICKICRQHCHVDHKVTMVPKGNIFYACSCLDKNVCKAMKITNETTDQEMTFKAETEDLWKLSHSPKYKYLLDHPIIGMFLALKWKKLKRRFQMDIRLSFLYVCMLTWYIFIMFSGDSIKGLQGNYTMFCNEAASETSLVSSYGYWTFGIIFACLIWIALKDDLGDLCSQFFTHPSHRSFHESFHEKTPRFMFLPTFLWYYWRDCMTILMGIAVLASPHWQIEGQFSCWVFVILQLNLFLHKNENTY